MLLITPKPLNCWKKLSNIGLNENMPDYVIRKFTVFNRINFLAFLTSSSWLLYILFAAPAYPNFLKVFVLSILLVIVSVLLAFLMYAQKFKAVITCTFFITPLILCALSVATGQVSIQFYLFVFCLLSFFFLHKTKNIVPVYVYLVCCFLITDYYHHPPHNLYSYVINDLIIANAFTVTFLTIYSIKREMWKYEKLLKQYNTQLASKNAEIETQKTKLIEQSKKLEERTNSLTELNDIKTKLFSVVSHDLKTHIYSLDRILAQVNNDEEIIFFKELLPYIKEQSKNTTALLDSLLNWSTTLIKSATPKPLPISLHELVASTIKLYTLQAQEKNITLHSIVEKDTFIMADKSMMEIAVRNIIANAIKFSHNGYPVIIEAHNNNNTSVSLMIMDYGVGISDDELEEIFSKNLFSMPGTYNEKGTGLGLLLTKELIEKNNGRLQILSAKNKGTKVHLTIPVYHNLN
jgi:two-component system, sensor histidine kinase and response regulator